MTLVLTISGKVSDYIRGLPVFISIQDPTNQTISLKSHVQSDGNFSLPYVISKHSQSGTYAVDATYKNQNLHGTIFELRPYDPNHAPLAQIETLLEQPFAVGKSIVFSALGSFDHDGTVMEYYWNFGDGVIGSNPRVPHAYLSEGVYCVSLSVTDDMQKTSSAYLKVAVHGD